jgi:acetolactate synthase-1/2/3 large subunit
MDYKSLAHSLGIGYCEVSTHADLEQKVQSAICHSGPVLIRVVTDYSQRKIRWIEAVRARFTDELTVAQKARFLARIGSRALREKAND